MKKTLITLAALAMASVAFAATPIYSSDSPSSEVTVDHTSASYTMVTVMDWDKAISSVGGGRGFIYGVDGRHYEAAMGFSILKSQLANDGTSFVAYIAKHNGTQYGLNSASTDLGEVTVGNMTTTTMSGYQYDEQAMYFTKAVYENEGKLALVLSYNDTNRTFTLGALTKNDTLNYITMEMSEEWQETVNNYKGFDLKEKASDMVESVVWYDTALTTNEMAKAAVAAIPEPTTATLSLLALAGLVARRRRK